MNKQNSHKHINEFNTVSNYHQRKLEEHFDATTLLSQYFHTMTRAISSKNDALGYTPSL